VRNSADNGFVLVATLWFVALLALAAIVVEGWVSSSLDRGAALGARVRAQSDLLSAEERIAFTLAGGSPSPRGLELALPTAAAAEMDGVAADAALPDGPFIALDDRAYRIGDVVVRLQDGAGLCDINSADRGTLGRLLKSYGITSGDAETLASALSDYTHKPADIRTGNIRDGDYRSAGLPLPRHAPLLSPWELLRVVGWEGRDVLWRRSRSFPEIATLGPLAGLNVNTASATVIAAMTGMDGREVARLVLARTTRPIADLREFGASVEVFNREDQPLVVTPSNIIRLKLIAPGEPLMRVIELRLTPTGKAPVRVDYLVDLPRDAASGAANAAPLPDLPTPPEAGSPR